MKQQKVNKPGDLVRHVVTHACRDSAPNRTFAARCSLEVRGSKIVFKWRIFAMQKGEKV